jgi:Tfp pilus assembly protein PilN
MDIRLNLATRPLLSQRRFLVGSALLGLLAGVLFLSLGWRFYSIRKADEAYRVRAEKVQQEMAQLQVQRDDLKRFFEREENRNLQDRAKFINGVIEARSFNWTKMFMDLERTLPPGVHVVRIEPKLDRGTVSVKFVVGASSQQAGVQLLKAFEDSKSFTHVELLSSQLPKQQSADMLTVEFSAIYTGI